MKINGVDHDDRRLLREAAVALTELHDPAGLQAQRDRFRLERDEAIHLLERIEYALHPGLQEKMDSFLERMRKAEGVYRVRQR